MIKIVFSDRKGFIYSTSFDLHYLTVSSKSDIETLLNSALLPRLYNYRVFHLTAALPDGRLSR
ncbi:hypothetical protein U3516DRAFT_734830 [Neocallimastix sp. 'constans']